MDHPDYKYQPRRKKSKTNSTSSTSSSTSSSAITTPRERVSKNTNTKTRKYQQQPNQQSCYSTNVECSSSNESKEIPMNCNNINNKSNNSALHYDNLMHNNLRTNLISIGDYNNDYHGISSPVLKSNFPLQLDASSHCSINEKYFPKNEVVGSSKYMCNRIMDSPRSPASSNNSIHSSNDGQQQPLTPPATPYTGSLHSKTLSPNTRNQTPPINGRLNSVNGLTPNIDVIGDYHYSNSNVGYMIDSNYSSASVADLNYRTYPTSHYHQNSPHSYVVHSSSTVSTGTPIHNPNFIQSHDTDVDPKEMEQYLPITGHIPKKVTNSSYYCKSENNIIELNPVTLNNDPNLISHSNHQHQSAAIISATSDRLHFFPSSTTASLSSISSIHSDPMEGGLYYESQYYNCGNNYTST